MFDLTPGFVSVESAVIGAVTMPSPVMKPTASPSPPATTVKPFVVSGVPSYTFSALPAVTVTGRGRIVIVAVPT